METGRKSGRVRILGKYVRCAVPIGYTHKHNERFVQQQFKRFCPMFFFKSADVRITLYGERKAKRNSDRKAKLDSHIFAGTDIILANLELKN